MLPDTGFLSSTLGAPLGLDLHFRLARGAVSAGLLSPAEKAIFAPLAHTARATSWLLGRAALKGLRMDLDERPEVDSLTFPDARFSLSHSGDAALAVAEPSGCLDGIGLDLEVDARIQSAAARFFLTPRERAWLRTRALAHRPSHLLRLWCVKEAVFKADPDNTGEILADYELTRPADPSGGACTRSGRSVEYTTWCQSRTCVALAVCR